MGWWEHIVHAVRRDLFDIPHVGLATSLLVRLLVAGVMGGLLGYERGRAGKSAGVRTHMLVSLGAAVFVVIPQQAGATVGEITRVIQGIVTGIGFLGAGTILKGDHGEVRGLTTAAGIWLTAAIGIAAGMGRVGSALLCTILALIVLEVVPRFVPEPGRDHRADSSSH